MKVLTATAVSDAPAPTQLAAAVLIAGSYTARRWRAEQERLGLPR
ncbi:MAG TPA: hypothetical protein VLM79_17405 [Kofleriaceae bacterium]|nr:hypothetical protein [Kofleriaceae bacterium]